MTVSSMHAYARYQCSMDIIIYILYWVDLYVIYIRLQMEGLDEELDNKDPHFQNAIQETHPPLQGSPLRLLIFGVDIDREVRIMHG